jgi:hypothetical protein
MEALFAEVIARTSAGTSRDVSSLVGSEFHQVVVFAMRPTLNKE